MTPPATRTTWGLAPPDRSLRQQDTARAAAACLGPAGATRQRALHALYRRTRIRRRGCALLRPGEQDLAAVFPASTENPSAGPGLETRMDRFQHGASRMAEAACRRALRRAAKPAQAIHHLVTVSCTGFSAPGWELGLIDRLGLERTVSRTTVGYMGCHGALNGWRVADALVRARGGTALLCCAEVCTAHFQYGSDPDTILANALFADGAAAAVVHEAQGTTPTGDVELVEQASWVLADTRELMSWELGAHGFVMRLSPRAPDVLRRHLRPHLEPWLAGHGVDLAGVGGWAIHPGGPRIVDTCLAAMGLPATAGDASNRVLRRHGNMSSPTVLFVTDRLRRLRRPGPWVALAFGPGLTIEAALLRPCRLP